ncbi:unnamed protein product [Macrosiphum euphorbiae]|uniref:MARVEL domain-containing protein n=1 Tax=Macrosiphum euphorbiae TaxID=13131 RepID=A0AAV0WTC2_9HEMI|nr:unnamed protein product [Macrosiphum euphorbiae]
MWYQNSAVTSISMFGFWFSLFMLVFYIFHVVECFYKIPWLKIEMIFDVCWPILYLLSASSAAAYTGLHLSYMISLLFGFAAMFAYGYTTWRNCTRKYSCSSTNNYINSIILIYTLIK